MKINKKQLKVVRIGDQLLIQQRRNKVWQWLTPGYYQLDEIADMFKGRLALFTAFGRIIKIKKDNSNLYKIPINSVPQFNVVGVNINKKGLWSYLQVFPALIWRVRKVTKNHDISWFMMPSLAGLIGILVASKRTFKVAQLVGEWSISLRFRYPKLAFFIVPLTEWLIRLALSRADLVVFVSDQLKQKYGRELKNKVMIANESRLRLKMFHKTNNQKIHKPLRILYIGRLVPEKGIQFLLEAVACISYEIRFELWIVGSGSFKSYLMIKANKLGIMSNIRWFGWIPWGEKLFKLMRKADLLILPSLTEGLGLVLIEAMSQSLPVIATRVGGIPEIVKDGKSGILIKPSDSLAIAQAIHKISTDMELRQKLIVGGWRIAENNTVETQTGKAVDAICSSIKN